MVGDARVTGGFFDSSGDAGASGQVLSSTGTGTNWIDAPSGVATAHNLLTGRINDLSGPAGTEFGSAIASTTAAAVEADITTLSSNLDCTAQALSVKLTAAPGAGNSRTFILRDDGADTVVTCTISDVATTCNSGTNTAVIAAGSELFIEVDNVGTPAAANALFGWECR